MAPKVSAAVGLVLAAVLVLPAVAATPRGGSWSGKTRQGKSISFRVTPGGGKVKKVKFGFRGSCGPGIGTSGTVTMPGPFKVVGGKFTAKGGSSVVRGTFTSATRAKGVLRQRSTYFDPTSFRQVECTSGKRRWTARR
jgi:hypothetical protein